MPRFCTMPSKSLDADALYKLYIHGYIINIEEALVYHILFSYMLINYILIYINYVTVRYLVMKNGIDAL